MHNKELIAGIGLGMAAGAAIGMMVSPKRKTMKNAANKAMKAVNNVMDNISEIL